VAQAPAIPQGFELPLEPRLPRIGSVDAVALEERAASLARRGEDVARYLKTTDPRVVRADCESLEQRVSAASDPEAKAQYVSALGARREHLDALRDLSNAKERIDATLVSIA